jgi:hypothetical protein
VVQQTRRRGAVDFDQQRLAGIQAGIDLLQRGGLAAADHDAAENEARESTRQARPDDQAAEKADPAAHILELAVHAGRRFAIAVSIDEHAQGGQGRAVAADGNGLVEAELLVDPLRVALGDIPGSEGHAAPPFLLIQGRPMA